MSKKRPHDRSSPPPSSKIDSNSPSAEESLEEILLQELIQKTSQLQQQEKRLTCLEQELDIARQIASCQKNSIVFIDKKQQIIYANNVFCSMTGRDQQSLKNKKISQYVTSPEKNPGLETALHKALHWGSWQGPVLVRDDNEGHIEMNMTTFSRDDCEGRCQHEGFICEFATISKSPLAPPGGAASRKITHDALTGLPDRPSFQDHFSTTINQAAAGQAHVALLFIDLDHFKRINRMLGSGVGDELLCHVTARIQRSASEAGTHFVARLSGDEFAVILHPPTNSDYAEQLAKSILQKFVMPLSIASRDIFITPSIGISLFPHDGENPPELLRNADTAMEMAKAKGGNSFCRWTKDMDTQAIQNLHLENDLRQAVANRELFNHYQPQIDLTTGAIIGMEALARWEHPVHGNISPVIFIPIAENTGLIEELGLDLVKLACEEGRKWRKRGFTNFIMAVNLSGSLLRRHDLFEQIEDCLESTGFPPTALEVEFTESVLIENMENTIELINKCRAKGIKMAIDDFGTGYSSLSYLQRFAVDKIKIDRSFIMDVTTNASDAAITMAIIAIAKKLNFEVLAEGVETEEQLFFLQENECDSCQGFLFSKPITAKEMNLLLLRDSSVALKHKRIIDKFYSIKANDA